MIYLCKAVLYLHVTCHHYCWLNWELTWSLLFSYCKKREICMNREVWPAGLNAYLHLLQLPLHKIRERGEICCRHCWQRALKTFSGLGVTMLNALHRTVTNILYCQHSYSTYFASPQYSVVSSFTHKPDKCLESFRFTKCINKIWLHGHYCVLQA